MSIGKVSEAVGNELGTDFKKMTPEEIKAKILEKFHEAYGRYENVSGQMAFEMSHADGQAGMVHWVQTENDVITEDIVIDREAAVLRFIIKQRMGYARVFEGTTDEDLRKENDRRIACKSLLDRQGLLGTYVNRQGEFLRVKEHSKGLYTIEKGYKDFLSSCQPEQTEAVAHAEIDFARDKGYVKEGEELEESGEMSDTLAKFLGREPIPKPVVEELEEGGFNPKWLK